jgi:isocitrate lyase
MTITERIREEADDLRARWRDEERWRGITRPYEAEDVVRLRGSIRERHVIAETSAEALWRLVNSDDYVAALGCLTGGQAVECARAGLRAIYLSGWQVAADANTAQHTYPDQSLYPVSSVPTVVRRLNNALRRADQIAWAEGDDTEFGLPIVADAEAGFGGRALRGSALVREEVRAPRGEGPGPHRPVHPDVGGGSPGRRRPERPDRVDGADRRAERQPPDVRRR